MFNLLRLFMLIKMNYSPSTDVLSLLRFELKKRNAIIFRNRGKNKNLKILCFLSVNLRERSIIINIITFWKYDHKKLRYNY